jgi:hypothetical protein
MSEQFAFRDARLRAGLTPDTALVAGGPQPVILRTMPPAVDTAPVLSPAWAGHPLLSNASA